LSVNIFYSFAAINQEPAAFPRCANLVQFLHIEIVGGGAAPTMSEFEILPGGYIILSLDANQLAHFPGDTPKDSSNRSYSFSFCVWPWH
jgi:hypothetical protein